MDIIRNLVYWARHVEPVAVSTFVAAIFALVTAIKIGNVSEGVITAVVVAGLGLLARSQVSPVGPEDDAEYEE